MGNSYDKTIYIMEPKRMNQLKIVAFLFMIVLLIFGALPLLAGTGPMDEFCSTMELHTSLEKVLESVNANEDFTATYDEQKAQMVITEVARPGRFTCTLEFGKDDLVHVRRYEFTTMMKILKMLPFFPEDHELDTNKNAKDKAH